MNYMNYMMAAVSQMNPMVYHNMVVDPVHYYNGCPMVFLMPQPIIGLQYPTHDSYEENRKGSSLETSGQAGVEDIKTTSEASVNNSEIPLKVQRIKSRTSKVLGKRRPKKPTVTDEESEWSEGESKEPESAIDFPKKCRSIKKKKYKQNASRNILTNIGNQLITFLCSSKKSGKVIATAFPNFSESEFKEFYEYSTRLRHDTDYYLNIAKLKKFWKGADSKYSVVVRVLSVYYLRWVIPLSILTSKKMSPTSRIFHSRARKHLLDEIKTLN